MAHPPYNIFSQNCLPDQTLAWLQERIPEAKVTYHSTGQWSEITGRWKRKWLQKPLAVRVTHDPDYYTGKGWQRQLDGMQGYFSGFPGAEARPDLFDYISDLAFSINFIFDSDPIAEDPRQQLVFATAELLDGLVFLPGYLINPLGHPIVSPEGVSATAALPASARPPRVHRPLVQQIQDAELPDPEPPTLHRIVTRLHLMRALVERGFYEFEKPPHAEQWRLATIASLKTSDAWVEAEPWELEALEAPTGTLAQKTSGQLCWQCEGAIILAWALSLTELPHYDQQVDVFDLYALTDRLTKSEVQPRLKSTEEMEQLAFRLLAIHWRLREFQINPKPIDFPKSAQTAWCGPMDLTLARLIDNDLEIQGQPLSQTPEDLWRPTSGILEERRTALHWLLGHDPIYSENDTST